MFGTAVLNEVNCKEVEAVAILRAEQEIRVDVMGAGEDAWW